MRSGSWRFRTAYLAACILMLQFLAGAFALGAAAAAPPVFDIFGNPLCINSMDMDNRVDLPVMPECCTTACAMASLLPPCDALPNSLLNPRSPDLLHPVMTFEAICHAPIVAHGPGNPRSPPVMG